MRDSLKAKMRAGCQVNGFWSELFSPAAAEIMASAGYDCAMIDCEHGPGDPGSAIAIMRSEYHTPLACVEIAETGDWKLEKPNILLLIIILILLTVQRGIMSRSKITIKNRGYFSSIPMCMRGNGLGLSPLRK